MGRRISFRGNLADGGQERIHLTTNNGLIGYKIIKFQLMPELPGTVDSEHVVQVFKTEQATVPTAAPVIDFENNRLLASGLTGNSTNITQNISSSIIFDNEVFNQDIFVTHTEANGSNACNYYIELEQIRLDLGEQTVATLKDIRNIGAQ
jgi:hypothetical protein